MCELIYLPLDKLNLFKLPLDKLNLFKLMYFKLHEFKLKKYKHLYSLLSLTKDCSLFHTSCK